METKLNGLDLVTQRRWNTKPSNPESSKRRRKKQQWNPGTDSDQTQAAKASGDAKRRDRTCLAAATMQKPSNPGADLTKPRRRKLQASKCGEWDIIWRKNGKEEQEKKIHGSVGWIEIECFELDFHKHKASPLSSISMKVKQVLCARFLEIESSALELLESKLVWNVS